VAAAITTVATGCSSFLDVNTNPNSVLSANADAILASALTTTAANYTGNSPSYNSYASWAAVYWGKSGSVSGFGEELTYNYSSSFYAGLFNNTYDNLNDYNIIQRQADRYPYHAAIARIMKAYNFQLLVDQYGDIPYTNALQGTGNVSPTYDKAADIYKDLIVQLNGAIDDINKTTASVTPTFTPQAVGAEDVVFAGNMTRWKKFANSLKLRILLRESQTNDAALNAYVATQMAAIQAPADGFIEADVVVQPGYAQNTGQQNPLYTRYAYTPAGTASGERSFQLPTQYAINQYLINNDPRVSQLYTLGGRLVNGANVPQYVGAIQGEASSPNFNAVSAQSPILGSRFLGANSVTASGGIFKGLSAPTAIMLLSEHLFSKSEAETRSLLSGDAKQDYLDAIKASFIYFYRAGTVTNATINASTLLASTTAGAAGISQYNTFINNTANTNNGLVTWDANTTTVDVAAGSAARTVSKQEKIIYQKYLAMNSVASVEAWDDYRRTSFPKLPASIQASTQGKFPTRLLYPLSEVSTNNANIPKGVDQYTKIFWDVLD
jgi:hypothetical protein